MKSQIWWYLSRSSGLVASALLMLSLVWGVLLATRVLRPADRPAWLLSLHRWFSALTMIGIAIHLAALVADNYVHFGLADLFIPMASKWKTGPVAYGIVSLYLLVIVQATSLMMKRIPKGLWRGIHMTSYLSVWLVAIHAGLAGTDVSNRIYQVIVLLLTILAVTASVIRVINGRFADRHRRAAPGSTHTVGS